MQVMRVYSTHCLTTLLNTPTHCFALSHCFTCARSLLLSVCVCAALGRPVDCKNMRRRSAACCAACLPVKLAVTRARQVRCCCCSVATAAAVVLLQLRGFFFRVFVCLFCLVWCRFNALFLFFCKFIDFFLRSFWFVC